MTSGGRYGMTSERKIYTEKALAKKDSKTIKK